MFAGLCDSCYFSLANSLLGGNWRDSEIIEIAALLKNLHLAVVTLLADGRVNNLNSRVI